MRRAPGHHYLIALGSNLGDRAAQLARAAAEIGTRLGPVLAGSRLYETPPVGGTADRMFLNAALVAASDLAPEAALAALLAAEAAMGRVRRERWGNRLIDLDLLLWRPAGRRDAATEIYRSATLILPHPAMLERTFVLVPAVEVAADWIHPLTGRPLSAALTSIAGRPGAHNSRLAPSTRHDSPPPRWLRP